MATGYKQAAGALEEIGSGFIIKVHCLKEPVSVAVTCEGFCVRFLSGFLGTASKYGLSARVGERSWNREAWSESFVAF